MPVSSNVHSTRITSITKENANAHFKSPSIDLELSHEPVGEDLELRLNDEGQLVVGYLAHDDDPMWDAFDYEEGNDEFKEFRSESDRDEFIAEQEAEGRVAFVVNKYAHGQVHYSIAGTTQYPDMRWDVAPSGVYVPCEENQERYKKEQVTEAQLIEWGNNVLNEYSAYCNGEAYGICKDVFEKQDDGSFDLVEDEACWNFITSEHAKSSLESDYLGDCKAVPEWKPSQDASADKDASPGNGSFLA
jgi:hypothetical protein